LKALDRYRPLVEQQIRDLAVDDEILGAAARYALEGGKRLRPCLLLAAADACGADWAAFGPAAAAVECIHAYSLVHDDLPAMDDDDLRRGRPTVHRAFGEAQAVLTGDGLLTLAFRLLAQPMPAGAEDRLAALREVAEGAGFGPGMVGGQALDLAGAADVAGCLRVASAKTGWPLGAAAASGAHLAGRSDAAAALRTYGREIGVAFQIKDDLLDVLGSEAAMGKRLRKDQALGRPNIAEVGGVAAAQAALREHSAAAIEVLRRADVAREKLVQLVAELMDRTS